MVKIENINYEKNVIIENIAYEDFEKIEIRSGTIVKVELFDRVKKPAYKVWADFGKFGVLQTSSQITYHYSPEKLLNKQVLGCINLGIKILLVLNPNFYYLAVAIKMNILFFLSF